MSDDRQLLARYAEAHSETAFSELVRRHIDLVYSAALRLTNGDIHTAQDLTQMVFAELARQARKLARHPAPAGWLYTTTRLLALRHFRTNRRRTAREQEAHAMNLPDSAPEPDWSRLQPVLDDAMHELNETDRLAVLLRFFQNKNLRDVGAALGLSENAARMRVDRALDKLRALLEVRGVKSTTGALALALAAHAVTAAPASVLTTVLASSTAASALAGVAASNLFNMTTLKIGALAAVIAAGVSTPLYLQHQAQDKLRQENQSLRRPAGIPGLRLTLAHFAHRTEPASAWQWRDRIQHRSNGSLWIQRSVE